MSVLTELRERCQGLSAGAVVDKALRAFGKEITISFSGAEDVLLIEYASQTGLPYSVMSLDTGRLHPETYRFFEKVESHYGIHIDYMFPRSDIVQALVREKGMFSFRTDGHTECCQIRKVEPLRRQLSTVRAWITGQRRDQSPTTRASLDVVELDTAFQGKDDGDLVKINPLVGMSSDEVWNAIRAFDVPHNELHERGFVSIGCEPCTRPILPGQHEREGRWWWENEDHKECGLHIKPGGS